VVASISGFGLVCGNCQAFNERSAAVCTACGASLRVGEYASATDREPDFKTPIGAIRGMARADRDEAPRQPAPKAAADGKRCPHCGASVPTDYRFCGTCGSQLEDGGAPAPEPESRGITEFASSGGDHTEALFGVPSEGPAKARLVVVHGEGVDGMSYALGAREHIAGRAVGQVLFPDDEHLSPKHCSFHWYEGRLTVRDEGSLNGVFYRILAPTPLEAGTLFLVGEQLMRFEPANAPEEVPDPEGTFFMGSRAPEGAFRLVQLLPGQRPGLVYGARNPVVEMGREGCDLNFPKDRFLSRRHAKVEAQARGFVLEDLGSRNGTFLRIDDEHEVSAGDHLFMGQQLLRVEIG